MAALADPAATTVVFMPKRTFAALVEMLVAHGLPAETPALFAENVSCPDQRLTRSTIADLARALESHHGTNPALILYGPLLEP